MEIDFLKMHGCGEDAIIVDGSRITDEARESLPRIAERILDRRFGVGGTALAVLGTAEGSVLPVRCFDSEGDEAGISCNVARCVARYASDSGAVSTGDFSLDVLGRKLPMEIIDSAHVRSDMGVPFSGEKTAEIRESVKESFTRSILVEGRSVSYTPISLGHPYAMLFVPDFSFPVRRTARKIAEEPEFPDGTGIGFVQVFSREEMRLRAWEADGEGPGDECACGAAALVAAVVNGFTDREVFLHLRGGDVYLQWDESDNHIRLTGPAVYVFTGTYDVPESVKE
jgi:diaminopimelate epimerase